MSWHWKKGDLSVDVLFSQAGLATQIFVRAKTTALLIDAGDGTLRDLLRIGVAPQELAGVFITHGHADHMAGLYGLLGYLRAEEHNKTFTVFYPKGCCEVEAMIGAFRRCYEDTLPYKLVAHPLADEERVMVGEAEVLARKVEHWHSIKGRPIGPAPAFGYRLTLEGVVVAISGDTAFCPAVVDLVRGADLALIEATLDEATPEQSTYLHLSESKARELADYAKETWFIHRPE